jgi:predicted  nucleic acid-binding Zn-ribbon protein
MAPEDAEEIAALCEREKLLRCLDQKVDGLRDDMREVKTRIGILEQQYTSLANRIDRIETRLDRIERRLDDLSDA